MANTVAFARVTSSTKIISAYTLREVGDNLRLEFNEMGDLVDAKVIHGLPPTLDYEKIRRDEAFAHWLKVKAGMGI